MPHEPKYGQVDGRNATAWVHPWERDTTRGYPTPEFPNMHNSEVEGSVHIATCQCCGLDFGFTDKAEVYCASHRWIGQHKFLGRVQLGPISYDDYATGCPVTGNNVRWSYFIPEEEPKNAIKLREVLQEWLLQSYPENQHFGPKVLLKVKRVGRNSIVQGVLVADLQRVPHPMKHGGTVDAHLMGGLLKTIDKIYCEVL